MFASTVGIIYIQDHMHSSTFRLPCNFLLSGVLARSGATLQRWWHHRRQHKRRVVRHKGNNNSRIGRISNRLSMTHVDNRREVDLKVVELRKAHQHLWYRIQMRLRPRS